ncbi:hypothetical protein [Pseudoalteromonas sp. SG43-4]|uniref:hypothetical protein n=1 Tax=Pseudoalteromonas sp. SG43-4 TaxID=2760969 RepID=UPI0015FF23BB|nr:hypothetical protein [Pseudoalteromonas sp. SG43-4]MBB1431969.1 hypothetical protein [Pseudoalteromonas sp. SG43-4]
MPEIPVNTLIPAGVIIASAIAGVFSFISLILSKEQKVSEFRQKWIESLRDDISDFLGNIVVLVDMKQRDHSARVANANLVFTASEIKDCQAAVSSSLTKIFLKLNPDDKNINIIALVKHLDEIKSYTLSAKWGDINEKVDLVREDSQKLLKQQWDRVKKGEPAFVWAKRFALSIFFGAFILGGYIVWHFI